MERTRDRVIKSLYFVNGRNDKTQRYSATNLKSHFANTCIWVSTPSCSFFIFVFLCLFWSQHGFATLSCVFILFVKDKQKWKRTKILIEGILQSHTYTLGSSWQRLARPLCVTMIIFKYIVSLAPLLSPKLLWGFLYISLWKAKIYNVSSDFFACKMWIFTFNMQLLF